MKPVFSGRFMRVSALTVVLLAGGAVSSAFGGNILPSPFFEYQIRGLPAITGPDLPGAFTGASCDALGNCQSSTGSAFFFNTNGNASLTAQATLTKTSQQITAGAGVTLIYYFGVFGQFNGPVPLRITGNLNSSASFSAPDGLAAASASAKIFTGLTTDTFSVCENSAGPLPNPGIQLGSCTDSSSLNYTDNVLVTPNPDLAHLGAVHLTAGCGADGGGCSATNDPTITFAPGFDSTGLTLEFSAAPPGATVTPEPPSLLFLFSGIALLAGLWRGRLRLFRGTRGKTTHLVTGGLCCSR